MSSRKGLWEFLFGFIGGLIDLRSDYSKIKDNPEAKAESRLLGKKSIKNTISALVCYAFMFGLIILGIKMLKTALLILGIVFIIMGAVGMLYPLGHILMSFSACIKQLKLNRKLISWVALFVWIIGLATIIILSILIINKINIVF